MTAYLETYSLDPTWNLAFEEYCLTDLIEHEKVILLWQNDNAIIIGRYQNAENEINAETVKKFNTRVVRRSTGGGTVYHDMGNLNYSFIFPIQGLQKQEFSFYAQPLVDALNKIGVPAEIRGRNDIVLDDKKISGTAQRIYKNRLLHHGTLLYDSNLDVLDGVLNVDASKIASKGISSVRKRVTNIKEHIPEGTFKDMRHFWDALLSALSENEELTRVEPSEQMLEAVRKLQKEKYQSWDWNIGSAPPFEFNNGKRYPGGKLEVCVNVENGSITECKISGDFLGVIALDDLQNALLGVKYDASHVLKKLKKFDLIPYLGNITAEEFVECMFEGTHQV